MLPRETSVRQLKKLRAETKGTDIGDLTKDDRLNHNVPNLQYIGNPVDTGIESWEEFSKKDSKLQTIAFKSKLVNKSIKENKKIIMKEKNILSFNDFEAVSEDLDDVSLDDDNDEVTLSKYRKPDYEDRDIEPGYYEEYNDETHGFEDYNELDDNENEYLDDLDDDDLDDDDLDDDDLDDDLDDDDLDDDDDVISRFSNYDKSREEEENELASDDNLNAEPINELENEFESVKTFEAFSVKAKPKEEKQPKYTMLGEEKEPKSDPNFGYAAVRAQEIKKITDFNIIDPPTPKERTIGGNSGVFIDNDIVKGYVNRIEGKNVYVESLDEPMIIKKFSLKDIT